MKAKIFIFGSRRPQPTSLRELQQQAFAKRQPPSAKEIVTVPRHYTPKLPPIIYLPYVPLV